MIPTVVSRSFNSVRMRQRTGKAVIEYATPVKSMKWVNWTEGSMKWLYKGMERAEPRPKGKAMPAKETIADMRALRLMMLASISRPTMKRKRQRPILATRDKYGSESAGNI
jgi:hypothetical protein